MTLKKKHFENIGGKRENAGNQHFLLLSKYFLPFPKLIPIFNLDQSEKLSLDTKEIKPFAENMNCGITPS